jgi:hypothetical protein
MKAGPERPYYVPHDLYPVKHNSSIPAQGYGLSHFEIAMHTLAKIISANFATYTTYSLKMRAWSG